MFRVETAYCVGADEVRDFASFEETLKYAKSLRDPNHTGSSRDAGTEVYSPQFGAKNFHAGVLACVDITVCGCVPSYAFITNVRETITRDRPGARCAAR